MYPLWLIAAAWWMVQDILQVFATPVAVVPDIYILMLGMSLIEERRSNISLLIAAFVGGLLWDMRWGSPFGFTALSYVGSLVAIKALWRIISKAARTPAMAIVLVFGTHLCSSAIGLTLHEDSTSLLSVPFMVKQIGALLLCFLMRAYLLRGVTD